MLPNVRMQDAYMMHIFIFHYLPTLRTSRRCRLRLSQCEVHLLMLSVSERWWENQWQGFGVTNEIGRPLLKDTEMMISAYENHRSTWVTWVSKKCFTKMVVFKNAQAKWRLNRLKLEVYYEKHHFLLYNSPSPSRLKVAPAVSIVIHGTCQALRPPATGFTSPWGVRSFMSKSPGCFWHFVGGRKTRCSVGCLKIIVITFRPWYQHFAVWIFSASVFATVVHQLLGTKTILPSQQVARRLGTARKLRLKTAHRRG